MNYPYKILPNTNLKRITCDLSDYYLIRYTSSKDDIYDEELKQVKPTKICDPSAHINDLSTSLLGVFETSFTNIELTALGKEKYSEYCEPDVEVELPVLDVDFSINHNRGFWVVLIGDIHNVVADYTRGNIDRKFKATCVVQHTPMKWNYWHFSIRWYTDELGFWHEISDNKVKSKLSARLAHEARSIIAQFAKIEEPNYVELDISEYHK